MADEQGALGSSYGASETMNKALGALGIILDPERAQATQDKAYWAGMSQGTHGGGRGEEMSNALKAQIGAQTQQDELKAKYIPLILQTLQAQRQMELQQPIYDAITGAMRGQPSGDGGGPAPGGVQSPPGMFGLDSNQTMGGMMTATPMFKSFGEAVLKNSERTNKMKEDIWAGITPAQRKVKDLMIETKPNQAIAGMDDKGNIIFKAVGADPEGGMQYVVSPEGKVTAIPVPNAAAIKGGMAGAVAQGKATQEPTKRWDAATGQWVLSTQAKDAAAVNGPASTPGVKYPTQNSMAKPANEDIGGTPAALLGEINSTIMALGNPNAKWEAGGKEALKAHLTNMQDQFANMMKNGETQGTQQPSGALLAAPAPGFEQGQESAQKELGSRYTALRDTASQAQVTSSYLQNIKQYAQKAATGPMADRIDYVNGLLSLVGSERAKDAVTANDLLEKYSNQIVARLGTGNLGTDAARAIVSSAYPNAKMNLQAINEAADNLIGANEMVKSKMAVLSPHGNARDPVKYQQKEQVFDANADPRIWQWKSLTDPAARRSFAASIMKQDPKFVDKIKALEGIGAF